jgi:hypothetical protein
MSQSLSPHYKLTQLRLKRKLDEANVLITRLVNRGFVPNLTLHTMKGQGPVVRTVDCYHINRVLR